MRVRLGALLVLQRGLPGFPGRREWSLRPFRSSHVALQRGLPGFPGRRMGLCVRVGVSAWASTGSPWFPREKDHPPAQDVKGEAGSFNGVSLVSQGEGRIYRRRHGALLDASTGSPWFPREKGAMLRSLQTGILALQRGLPGFPGRRLRFRPVWRASVARFNGVSLVSQGEVPCLDDRARVVGASTGSPWFPREKGEGRRARADIDAGLQRGLPGFPGRRSSCCAWWVASEPLQRGLPGFPGRRLSAASGSIGGYLGFNGVSLVSQGEGWASRSTRPRQPASFNGVSLVSQGEGWRRCRMSATRPCFNGVSLVSQGEGSTSTTVASSPSAALQRGLPGFPGRRRRRASPLSPRRRCFNGVSLVSQGEGG